MGSATFLLADKSSNGKSQVKSQVVGFWIECWNYTLLVKVQGRFAHVQVILICVAQGLLIYHLLFLWRILLNFECHCNSIQIVMRYAREILSINTNVLCWLLHPATWNHQSSRGLQWQWFKWERQNPDSNGSPALLQSEQSPNLIHCSHNAAQLLYQHQHVADQYTHQSVQCSWAWAYLFSVSNLVSLTDWWDWPPSCSLPLIQNKKLRKESWGISG